MRCFGVTTAQTCWQRLYLALRVEAVVKKLTKEYEVAKFFGNGRKAVRVPLYWGGGESTSGPVYFGAIVAFLMILGLDVVTKFRMEMGRIYCD